MLYYAKKILITTILLCIMAFIIQLIMSRDAKAQTVHMNEVVVEKAKSYLHVREQNNNNRSPEIDKFHKYYGLPYGNPWCMMFVGYSYYEAFSAYNMKTPLPRFARVSTFSKHAIKNPLTYQVISTKKLMWGVDTLLPGDMVAFKHGKISPTDTFTWDGHIEIGMRRDGKTFICIGGNTKPSAKGDQTGRTKHDLSAGLDGVYIRERTLGLNTNFPIVYIIRLKKRTFEL